jgi:protein-tyrosine kinase
VSKFFRALENAEKERAAGEPPPTQAADLAVAEEARATATADDERAVGPSAGRPVGPSAGRPVRADTPGGPGLLEISRNGAGPHPAPAEIIPEIEPASPPDADESSGRAAGYGAPVARATGRAGGHAAAFVDPLEPADMDEERAGEVDDHLVSLLAPTSFAAEQYRTVRLAVETARHERGVGVIAVSSPGRGEGKTITAVNLAGALAQASEARVVLVDADLRHPRVAGYLGLPSSRGLSTYLLDQSVASDEVIVQPPGIAFSVVVAGPVSSMPYELLKAPRLTALFHSLRTRFDFVVVDTPPALLFPDVGLLRDHIDGFLMVVRANRTPREGLSDTLEAIGRHRVIGLLFNDDQRNPTVTSGEEPDHGWLRSLVRPFGGGVLG